MRQNEVSSHDGHAAGRDVTTSAAPVNNIHEIRGGTNIIGNQGSVSVVMHKPPVVRRVVQPTGDHISQAQAVELHALKDEWVALHNAIKKKPLSHGAAWKAINAAGGATMYREIHKERFAEAVAFVRREMAILRSMKSAPRKDGEWRAKRIGAIKARCKNQLGGADAYKPYIQKKFGAASLADLATDELQQTYAYVMAKKTL